jgi:hypothetical protein
MVFKTGAAKGLVAGNIKIQKDGVLILDGLQNDEVYW